MMMGLFVIYTAAVLSLIGRLRYFAIACILIGLVLSAVMFWWHTTSTIDVRL